MADSKEYDTGLVHACLLDGEGGGRDLSWAETQEWGPEDGELWLHFDRASTNAQNWVRDHSGPNPLAAEALFAVETRPRCINFDDGMHVILHGVNLNPGAELEDMVAIRLWIDEHRVISMRSVALLTAQDTREDFSMASPPRTPPS